MCAGQHMLNSLEQLGMHWMQPCAGLCMLCQMEHASQLFVAVALQMHCSSAHEPQTFLHSNKQRANGLREISSHCYECPQHCCQVIIMLCIDGQQAALHHKL